MLYLLFLHYVFFITYFFFFFFNDTATTEIYTLSLHDALPIGGGHWRRSPHSPSGSSRTVRRRTPRPRRWRPAFVTTGRCAYRRRAPNRVARHWWGGAPSSTGSWARGTAVARGRGGAAAVSC